MAKPSEKLNTTLVFADTDNGGVIHVANIKGGVGKSTVATNLGAALARKGPTLVIDLDVQGSATHALGKEPSDFRLSSWELFRRRFSLGDGADAAAPRASWRTITSAVRKAEAAVLPHVVGKGELNTLCVTIGPGFDLIPAGSELFHSVNSFHISNFLYNLDLCRGCYTYIVLDTPSVWSRLTHALFTSCDLNLIPVTLNALSTKSLRDYLVKVKRLSQRDPAVRVRIVKNEVFGKENSKVKGKTRTMGENRRFLERLCEQSVLKNEAGVSMLPQSILFDLEIPESAAVRDAQDEGKSLHEFHQYAVVTKAFDELARRVQYVLNRPVALRRTPLWLAHYSHLRRAAQLLAAAVLVAVLGASKPVLHDAAPRPVPPMQLRESQDGILKHVFLNGDSFYRIVKYAITYFTAVVPSPEMVESYAHEVVDLHNLTRANTEPDIASVDKIPEGAVITFLHPSMIVNPHEKELVPVYRFFGTLVDDPFAYITGDWCERGTGGGQPHYGIDVAANLGCNIITPIDGTVVLNDSRSAGRTLGVVKGTTIITFSHMNQRFFKNGDEVRKGQAVGTIGLTGNTSGPHVHVGYGVRVPGGPGSTQYGKYCYKLTDPKLFFYREKYLASVNN